MATIGYGELFVKTVLSRILLFISAFIGIGLITML